MKHSSDELEEPQMDADQRGSEREKMRRMTEKVIGCAFTVSNTLGCGFLEKVYETSDGAREERGEKRLTTPL